MQTLNSRILAISRLNEKPHVLRTPPPPITHRPCDLRTRTNDCDPGEVEAAAALSLDLVQSSLEGLTRPFRHPFLQVLLMKATLGGPLAHSS